jgi:hypothetical protein
LAAGAPARRYAFYFDEVAEAEAQGLPYRSSGSPDWLKMKNANAPAAKREEEEDWGT